MLVLGDAHAADPSNREALLAAYDAVDVDVALQAGDLLHYDLPVEGDAPRMPSGLLPALLVLALWPWYESRKPELYETASVLKFETSQKNITNIPGIERDDLSATALRNHIRAIEGQTFYQYYSQSFTPQSKMSELRPCNGKRLVTAKIFA